MEEDLSATLIPTRLSEYLVSRRLIPRRALVDGDLTLESMPGRNYNLRVTGRSCPSLLVKQSGESFEALSAEAKAYRALQDSPAARYLPRLRSFDRKRRILVLDLVERAQMMRALTPYRRFRRSVGMSLGRALAAVHCSRVSGPMRSVAPPWVLSISRPPIDILREISEANLRMIRLVQESASLCRGLDQLALSWRNTAFIHNDVRWENCLLIGDGARLKLVDWELAGIGDPDWDIGSVFSELLADWIYSMEFEPGLNTEQLAATARSPLGSMRPLLNAFWRAYVDARKLGPEAARESATRACQFAAVRLIACAYERQQKSSELTGNTVCLLQLSANILADPDYARSELLHLRSM